MCGSSWPAAQVKCWANGWCSLHYAARNGHADILAEILSKVRAAPVNVGEADNVGCTPAGSFSVALHQLIFHEKL